MDAVPMVPPMVTTDGLAGLSLAEAADAFARGEVTATAEAPPEMTSTFLISAVGIRLTSTVPSEFDGTTRRPFIRTSVRFEPRLRRLMLA